MPRALPRPVATGPRASGHGDHIAAAGVRLSDAGTEVDDALDRAERWAKGRVLPMVEASPVLLHSGRTASLVPLPTVRHTVVGAVSDLHKDGRPALGPVHIIAIGGEVSFARMTLLVSRHLLLLARRARPTRDSVLRWSTQSM